jgi:hypothetical protein
MDSIVQNTQADFGNQEFQSAVQGTELSALQDVILTNVSMGLAGVGQEASNTENIGMMQTLARHKNNDSSDQEPQIERVQSVLQQSGRPLPKELRERLERSFGHDLSDVRIHTDGQAQLAAQSIHAQAFAAGTHIAFNRGAYGPNTKKGDELIGHEVAHVVQFKEGRMGRATDSEGGVPVTSPSDGVEREAEQRGAEFASGMLEESASMSAAAPMEHSVDSLVARKEAEEGPEDRPDIDLEKAEEEKKRFEESGKKEKQKEKQKENEESKDKTEENESKTSEEQEKSEEEGTKEGEEKVEPEQVSMGSTEGGGGASVETGSTATAPQLDGLVDYYMETHWDRSEYREKLEEYDLLVSEYSSVADGLNLSDGASTALGWAGDMLKIGTDAILIGGVKAIPGVGAIFHVAYGVRDIIKNNKDYGELNDSFGNNVANLQVSQILWAVLLETLMMASPSFKILQLHCLGLVWAPLLQGFWQRLEKLEMGLHLSVIRSKRFARQF